MLCFCDLIQWFPSSEYGQYIFLCIRKKDMCQHISQLFLLRKNVVHHETFCVRRQRIWERRDKPRWDGRGRENPVFTRDTAISEVGRAHALSINLREERRRRLAFFFLRSEPQRGHRMAATWRAGKVCLNERKPPEAGANRHFWGLSVCSWVVVEPRKLQQRTHESADHAPTMTV